MHKISLGYNAVPASARDAILAVFDSGQFSPGEKVKEFEEKFAALHGSRYAVFVNSGTDALRLSLLAMKEEYAWPDGSGVMVPALTFVATVNVILQAGLKPVFIDVDPATYCLNPRELELCFNADIVAVMPVHLFGQACDSHVFELAARRGYKVLEDSCETILNKVKGDVSCHSTYMAHHLTTGVGGFAVTNDIRLDLLIRSLANHGRSGLYLPGHSQTFFSEALLQERFRFERIGYSSRGTEFEAALGISQLNGLEENVRRRQECWNSLLYALGRNDQLKFQNNVSHFHTAMMFPIVLQKDSGIDKYDLCLHLEKNGIETRDMMPITNQPCYQGLVNEDDFPVAKNINKNGFYIPVNPGMTPEDIAQIKKAFESYLLKR